MVDGGNSFCIVFFFFQAEDGIRDYKVTGVQTCALPISRPTLVVLDEAHRMKKGWRGEWGRACLSLAYLAARRDVLTGTPAPNSPRDLQRSEERRVGKECRSRWSPYH